MTQLQSEIPYADPAREILRLFKTKAPDADFETPIGSIQATATGLGVADPLIPSTDAYVTAICYLGSKSLSHVLSQIERSKDRLLAIGPASESARRQIITSVMEYWAEKPGVGVNIVDKLLNYTILTPQSVIQWALGDQLGKGETLTVAHTYEIVASTVAKVTNRIRQIVIARNAPGLPADQRTILDQTLAKEREELAQLFAFIEDALVGVAEGSNDAMAEGADQDGTGAALLARWGRRWLRVMRRKRGVEDSWVLESLALAQSEGAMEGVENGVANGHAVSNGAGQVAS